MAVTTRGGMTVPDLSVPEVDPAIATHEARHAAAALVLGLEVKEARADNPSPDMGGYMMLGDDAWRRAREHAIMSLAGRWGDPGWPPEYPSKSGYTEDERQLADEAGPWLCSTRGPHPGVHETCGKPELEHKTVKATARTTTDLGEFTALAAAWSKDRQGDQIVRGAFANTIEAWQDRNRPIPLHWAHKGDAEYVIGHADPYSLREIAEGLYVKGKLDLDGSEMTREAWRLVNRPRRGRPRTCGSPANRDSSVP